MSDGLACHRWPSRSCHGPFGVGGHCLPIDPSYLSWRVERPLGQRFRFVELANDINSHMPDYVMHRLLGALNERGRPVRGSRVLLLGLVLQEEHRRRAGIARHPGRPVARSHGSGRPGGRPSGDRSRHHQPGGGPRRRHALARVSGVS